MALNIQIISQPSSLILGYNQRRWYSQVRAPIKNI